MSAPSLLHTSIYTLYAASIPGGRFIIAHEYTVAIDVVEENVVSFLKECGRYRCPACRPALSGETIDLLKSRGYLTTQTPDEERKYASGLASLIHNTACSRSSFMFFVGIDCDFNSPYSFCGS